MATVLHNLAVEISAKTTKFAEGIKNAQKPMQNFASGVKEFGNQTNIAGHNLGGLASQFTSFLNPATAAAGVISGLGAAYLNTHAGAEALEEVQFRLEASFELLGRETSKLVDTMYELGRDGDSGGDSALGNIWKAFKAVNPLVGLWNYSIFVTDKLTGGYITKLGEEEEALAALKGIYDDLLRDRIIESEQISELERQIEKLKTQRVEENVTTKEKIDLDRQILKLEEDRFLILVADAEKRRQALELQATQLGGINNLNDKQLELLINTRNEVKNLEAEYELRIRKIRKELTGLLEDLGKASSFKFDRSSLKDTGNVNFPGEFQRDTFDQDIADKQLDSIVKETEAILGLGAAYGTLNFNYAQYRAGQEDANEVAQESIDITSLVENSLISLGDGLGDAISGVGNFGDALINSFADFASQFGKLLIASGLAKIAFERLKFSGAGAVAAGIALVAVARATSNKINSSAGGGGGSASIPSQRADTSRGERIRERPEQIQLGGTIEVNGEKMLVVLKNAGQKSSAKRG
jgi:hypothetical protein